MAPSADLKARLLAEVKRAPSPTRAAQQRLATVLLSVVGAVVAAEFFSAPHGGLDLGGRPVPFVAFTSAAWAMSLGALLLAIRSRPPLGPPRAVLVALAVGSLAFPYGVGLVGNAIYPSTAVAVGGHPGLVCLELSLAWSTLPLTAWVFVRRESDPVHPVALGAAIGALAACLSGLLVNLACRFSDPAHIALGHLLPGAIEVAIGALMGRLLIAVRAQRAPLRTGAAIGAALGGWLVTLLVNLHIQRTECPTSIEPRQVVWLIVGLGVGGIAGGVVASLGAHRRVAPST